AVLSQAGCSGLVAASGQKLGTFTSRAQVHETFGQPITVADRAAGGSIEVYKTHRKICDQTVGEGIIMLDTLTLGLAELYLFPYEVIVSTRRSVLGQRLEVEYDSAGQVVVIRCDGEEVYGTRHTDTTPAARAVTSPAALPESAAQPTTTGTARLPQPPSGTSP
ncbi:MAG TPA: hypothetical protein VH092_25800, partial [Urbifossiella sp.]|nr:hypothetical protein [Urbifossiella sp.]